MRLRRPAEVAARDLNTAMAPAAAAKLGRFELIRVIGRGAQATVWLAHDTRLERDVAVKLMHADAANADAGASVMQWLQEARNVARLTHPHIVPVFEADVDAGRPYVVFEYVPGPTLAELMRSRGVALAPPEAVAIMIGVLDAVHAAHASGVVHRDLKPSNILVGPDGRARVMDFGIAARAAAAPAAAGAARRIVGTPGYISPEAARGEAPAPAMDIYAAGLVLAAMLHGGALIREPDPLRAIDRAANEDIVLPTSMPADVDDALRAIVLRAVARDATQRTPSAAAMRDALQAWSAPPLAPAAGGDGPGALAFLLRRMRHKSDFPALSDAVIRIQRVASSERESLASLSAEILKDVALTNKLLRVVNTAHYAQAGAGGIGTVSRATALIGVAGIRNLALGLVLLEHMQDKSHANQLKAEFLRSQLAGAIASRLSSGRDNAEEAFIGALLQNLGRLLTQFYFPEEARQIERLIAADRARVGEEMASIQVLGMSFEELGIGVARSWGLPDGLQRSMRVPRGEPPRAARVHAADRLPWLTAAANEIAATLLDAEPDQLDARLNAVALRYCGVLDSTPRQLLDCAAEARCEVARVAAAMGITIAADSAARRLLALPAAAAGTSCAAVAAAPNSTAAAAALPDAQTVSTSGFAPTVTVPGQPRAAHDACAGETAAPATAHTPPAGADAAEMLVAGIQEITDAMVENLRLDDVLRIALETLLRSLQLERVVFCLRDPKTGAIGGRFGLGATADGVARRFAIEPSGQADLFAAVCRKGADTLITDAHAPRIAARLPPWYRQHVNAPAFVLLPLVLKGATFALIYADAAQPGRLEIGARERSLIRTLRNQVVMAFRQAA